MKKHSRIGNRIAPSRFSIFIAMFGAGFALATVVTPCLLSVMLGFDVSKHFFIANCINPYKGCDPLNIRKIVIGAGANRTILLGLAFALALALPLRS